MPAAVHRVVAARYSACDMLSRASGGAGVGGHGKPGVCCWRRSSLSLLLLALCCLPGTGEGLIMKNGSFVFCGTSPEQAAQHATNRIERGFDTIRIVERQQCEGRTREQRQYRTYDGTCNAPDDLGAVFSPVKRLMEPRYEGSNSAPRDTARSGRKMPSAREVSMAAHRPKVTDTSFSLMLMQMGQFLDHDISVVPVATDFGDSIRCCGVEDSQRYIDCYPIVIPEGDPTFTDCMEFVRSDALTYPNGTVAQPRTHLNAITGFLDASMIYGSDRMKAKSLRARNGTGALLLTSTHNGQERLPQGHPGDCINIRENHFCAMAGDDRVNEQPGLTAIHTVFHLEHNRLVRRLAKVVLYRTKRSYSDSDVENYLQTAPSRIQEKMYQTVRKAVGAVWQNIVYGEYLPEILGGRFMSRYALWTGRRAPFDRQVDPSVSEEFLASAFRFGHTLVNDFMLTDKMRTMKDLFGVSEHVLENFNNIVSGLVSAVNHAETFDTHIASSLTDHLFESQEHVALDLASLNIQRGRDHGLPRFNEMRKFFGMDTFKDWNEFGSAGKQLKNVYEHVDDVDSFTGGTAERVLEGGVVGETFAHIIAKQFHDLKFGDRYFFETDSSFYGLTNNQLRAVHRMRFSKILCENSELQRIQSNPFRHAHNQRNPMHECSFYPDIDLWHWSDNVLLDV